MTRRTRRLHWVQRLPAFTVLRFLLALMLVVTGQTALSQPASPTAQPLLLASDTTAAKLDPALEFLLDATGTLTAQAIDAMPAPGFAPVVPGARHRLEGGALWLRFDAVIQNPDGHWRLTVPLPGVEYAALHFRNAEGKWVTQRAGSRLPISSWAQPARHPVFSLAHEIGKPVRYYVEVRHPRVPYSVMPRIENDTRLIRTSQSEHMLLGAYFGLAALVITLALANALAYRDSGFGTYALYIALFAASQGAFTGIAGLYWWPQWPELNAARVFLLPVAAAAAMWFVRTVTRPSRFTPKLDRLMLVLMVILPPAGFLDAALPTPEGFIAMNALIGLSMVVLLVVIAFALVAGDYYTRWVAAGFLPVLVSALFPLLRNLGVIASSFWSDYALLLGSAVEVPILFYGLHRRMSQRRELRVRAHALGSSDPLTGLHASPVLVARLHQSLGKSDGTHQPLGLLLINLSNLPHLQKTYGRDTADRALVMAADRIRAIAHATDTVARVGESQFALLMARPTSAAATSAVATKILASGLRLSHQLPDAEPLLFHIAVGLLDASGAATPVTSAGYLAAMLQAAKDMDDGSRKAIRQVNL